MTTDRLTMLRPDAAASGPASGVASAEVAAYALGLGDDALMLAQRLGEWIAHAPEHAAALRRKAAHGGTPSYLRDAILAALDALGEG